MPHTIGWDENAIGGLDHLARGRVSFRRSLDVERAGAVQQDNPSPFSSHNLVELSIHRAQARDYQVKKPEIFERVIEFIEGKMMPLWFSTVWCVNVYALSSIFDHRCRIAIMRLLRRFDVGRISIDLLTVSRKSRSSSLMCFD